MKYFALFGARSLLHIQHGIRIETEEKAQVVAPVWGTELIKFIIALAILYQDDLKKGINSLYPSVQIILFFILSLCNSSYSSNFPGAKIASRGKKLIDSAPNSNDTLCLLFCLYPSAMINTTQYVEKHL